MIYILDDFSHKNSHGNQMKNVVRHFSTVDIVDIDVPNIIDNDRLYNIFEDLLQKVLVNDIVLICWAKEIDILLDDYCNQLGKLCHVLVSAGNSGLDIKDYSPTRAKNVTVVGCLNKKLVKASHSNYSDKVELVWIVGTNLYIDGIKYHGTSTSASIYAGMLANSLSEKSQNLQEQIDIYHNRVKLD